MKKVFYAKVAKSARYCRHPQIRKKLNLFLEVLSGKEVKVVCKRYGVSRSNYYRWWKRFRDSGFSLEALQEKSRRPKSCPHKKNAYYIKLNHRIKVSASTIQRIIQRNGWVLKKYRTKKINPHKKRYNLPWPGMCLQLDIKYVPRKIQGKQYYVFNAIDDCTRWRFAKAYEYKTKSSAVRFLRELILNVPFKVLSIQTDNDTAFTYRFVPEAFGKKHPFDSNLEEMGPQMIPNCKL